MAKSAVPSVTRRSIRRAVVKASASDAPITGRDVHSVAVCLASRLGLHPVCIRKTEEVVAALVASGTIVLRDATLVVRDTPHLQPSDREVARRRLAQKKRAKQRERGELAANAPGRLGWLLDEFGMKPIS